MSDLLEDLLRTADDRLLVGQVQDALDALDQAVRAAPADPRPYARRAALLIGLAQTPPGVEPARSLRLAVADLDRAIALGGKTAAVCFLRLRALAELSDLPAARAACAEALALDGGNPRLREWGVRLAIRAGDPVEALRLVRAELAAAPNDFGWQRWEAEALLLAGDWAAARESFAALIAAHAPADPEAAPWEAPGWGAIYLQRAEACRRMGDFDAALADLDRAESFVPDDPALPFGRGLIAWAQGDKGRAFALLRAGLAAAGPGVRTGFWRALAGYPRLDELRTALGEETP